MQGAYQRIPQADPQDRGEDTDPDGGECRDRAGELVRYVVGELRRQDFREKSNEHVWVCDNELALGRGDEPASGGRGPAPLVSFGTAVEALVYHLTQCLVVLDLAFVPFVIAFRPVYEVEAQWQVAIVDVLFTGLFFLLAVPLRMRTSFICPHERREIREHDAISSAVLHSHGFWMDLVSLAAAPMLYVPAVDTGSLARPLQMLALLRLAKCWQLGRPAIRDICLGSESFGGALSKVFLAIFLIAHFFACLWFWGKESSPEELGREWAHWNGWSDQGTADDRARERAVLFADEALDQLWVSYVRALKDGVFMLTTWGGPDPLSDLQLVLSCLLGPASAVASGLILATIVEINARFSSMKTQYANKMAMVSAACDALNLPHDLRSRISRYHSYLAFHQADETSREMLFNGVSVHLLAEVKLYCLKDVMVATPFFDGLPSRLLSFLIISFEETTYSPGDFVVRKGETGDRLHIIIRGMVAVCITDASDVLKVLHPGACFGEISMFWPFPRTAWCYAVCFAMLMGLTKEKFDYVLQECPTERDIILRRILLRNQGLVGDLEKVTRTADMAQARSAKEVLKSITDVLKTSDAGAPGPDGGAAGQEAYESEAHSDKESARQPGKRLSDSVAKRLSVGSMSLGQVAGTAGDRRLSINGAAAVGHFSSHSSLGNQDTQPAPGGRQAQAEDRGGDGAAPPTTTWLVSLERRFADLESRVRGGMQPTPSSPLRRLGEDLTVNGTSWQSEAQNLSTPWISEAHLVLSESGGNENQRVVGLASPAGHKKMAKKYAWFSTSFRPF